MRLKKVVLACGAILLVLPTIALAGGRPPEGVDYAQTGATTLASTHSDKDGNKSAEKVDLTIGIYKCGNNVPFTVENVKIKRDGTYSFSGKAENFAGQTARLIIKGKFKNAKKIVQKTTIKSGSCKRSERATLKRQS